MKINKFTSLFATCLLMGLTACSNDNVSDADYSNSAKDKDLTGKTSFSITSEAKTRTSGVYNSGGRFLLDSKRQYLGKKWLYNISYTNSK